MALDAPAADAQRVSWPASLARQRVVAESLPSCRRTDLVAFATYAFVASRSAGVDPAGISALSSGPCPPSLTQSPTTTSALPAARVALPADRSPYKSSPTCIASPSLADGSFNCPRLNYDCPRSVNAFLRIPVAVNRRVV